MTRTMKAMWLENQVLQAGKELPIPTPPPGEALVRLRLGGICATDLEMVRGYYPFTGVPGHEFAGEIVSLPVENTNGSLQVGQRVAGEINAVCGVCAACRAGRATHCERRTVLGILNRHGVFAEYFTLPVENLHPIPDSVPDEAAVFTEPLAAALEILEQVHMQPDTRVLLVGAGRLGQLIAQVLALTGCDLQVVARHDEQRCLLDQRQIRHIPAEAVVENGYDLVIEATGSPKGFAQAAMAVRPRGQIVLKSTYAGDLTLNMSRIVVDEVTLIGSRCGPFPPALRLLESRMVDPTILIAGSYRLEQGVQAFERAAQPGVLKILLRP